MKVLFNTLPKTFDELRKLIDKDMRYTKITFTKIYLDLILLVSDSCDDPKHTSRRTILIPAMEHFY